MTQSVSWVENSRVLLVCAHSAADHKHSISVRIPYDDSAFLNTHAMTILKTNFGLWVARLGGHVWIKRHMRPNITYLFIRVGTGKTRMFEQISIFVLNEYTFFAYIK